MPAILPSSSIQNNQSKGLEVGDKKYFIIRRDNKLYAFENQCPHLGIPLEWQKDQFLDSDNELIQCSTHGALFIIESGLCVSGPCSGEHLIDIKVEERDGTIYLDTE